MSSPELTRASREGVDGVAFEPPPQPRQPPKGAGQHPLRHAACPDGREDRRRAREQPCVQRRREVDEGLRAAARQDACW